MVEARLEVTDSLGRRIVPVSKDQFGIGRRVTSDLHLPSGEVSRDHAEIVREGTTYVLRDRVSRYGTFVNGDEVKERTLVHGDRIRLGRTGGAEMVFLLTDSTQSAERTTATAVTDLHQVAVLLEGVACPGLRSGARRGAGLGDGFGNRGQ